MESATAVSKADIFAVFVEEVWISGLKESVVSFDYVEEQEGEVVYASTDSLVWFDCVCGC